MPGIDEQSFMDFYSGTPCKACDGEGTITGLTPMDLLPCLVCDGQGLVWPDDPPSCTDADRAYDRQAFAADYGLRPQP